MARIAPDRGMNARTLTVFEITEAVMSFVPGETGLRKKGPCRLRPLCCAAHLPALKPQS